MRPPLQRVGHVHQTLTIGRCGRSVHGRQSTVMSHSFEIGLGKDQPTSISLSFPLFTHSASADFL